MRDALRDLTETARGLWRDRPALLLFLVTYLTLLGTMTLFVITREATIKQVLLTFASLLAAPALFFLLQAMCINLPETKGARALLRLSLKNCWKLMLVGLPFIILAGTLYLLLGKVEARLASPLLGTKPAALTIIFSTVRLLLFGLVIPLASIHLWIALTRADVRSVLGGLRPIMARAFAPRSVLTYALGLLLFGGLPYLFAISRISFESAWAEMTLLGARLFLALSFILLGWVITVGALKRGMSAER